MSLLILFESAPCPPEDAAVPGGEALAPEGLHKAMLDAIHKIDDRIGGQAVTRLTQALAIDEVDCAFVESTINFGEYTDGTTNSRFLINGEIIDGRQRNTTTPFLFGGLTRGVLNTEPKLHPEGSLVFDLSQNASDLDHLRRGFLVNFALGADLDTIGRNLGLVKCPGITDEQWRAIIKGVAYLPKQTIDAFNQALLAALGDTDSFEVIERIISDPWKVFVEIAIALSTSIRGRFLLNSGEPQVTSGLTTVDADYPVIEPTLAGFPGSVGTGIYGRVTGGESELLYPATAAGTAVVGVFDDTPLTRRGFRDGLTNYFLPGGSVSGTTITLGTSPGAAGTPVLIDYTAFSAHYLALDETVRDDSDVWAYLADPLLAARCLLDQVRAAGVKVELSTKL
jgi:hypothetical protein